MNSSTLLDDVSLAGPCKGQCTNGGTTGPRPPPNILIVDDKPADLRLLVETLARRDYRTRTVDSGHLVLQVARTETPDLILLDVTMPEMSGYEVCESLKADAALKDIPVIFISALSETFNKLRAFRAGCVDYVTKPFQLEEVYARVETHLRIRSLQRQLNDQNRNLERLVAERTRELSHAYDRLRQLGTLKNDFLRMISHEIRTPTNGVIGVSGLILDLCPASANRDLYASLLDQSARRLRNLVEDATLISEMEQLAPTPGLAISFPHLLAEVRAALPKIGILVDCTSCLDAFSLNGYHSLLAKAMESVILLATYFSRNKHRAHVRVAAEETLLRIRIELDALPLSSDQVGTFFEIESGCRSASKAESLGLAPVVAHQIIAAFGGALRLVKAEGESGYLEATLRKEQCCIPSN